MTLRSQTSETPETPESAETSETSGETTSQTGLRGGAMRVPRSRGALSGVMLIVLGLWGALIPFIGPYFDVSYTPDTTWHWTDARGWLEVLPGAVAFVGGLLSLASANRAVISLGAWFGVVAGAWFIIGRDLANWFRIGTPGVPAGSSRSIHAVESLVMFSGLGALILFFAAIAVGRLSVRGVRDVRVAQRRIARDEARERAVRDESYDQGRDDALAAAREESARRQAYPAAPPPPANEGTTAPATAPPATAPPAQHASPEYAPPAGPTRTEPVTERDTRATR